MKQSKLNKQIQTAIDASKSVVKTATQTAPKAAIAIAKKSPILATTVAGIKIGFSNERIKNTPARKKTAPKAGK